MEVDLMKHCMEASQLEKHDLSLSIWYLFTYMALLPRYRSVVCQGLLKFYIAGGSYVS